MKDSLIPIVGEKNMRRDYPKELQIRKRSEKVNKKLSGKGLILGKSATEINKMSRETMDEVLKSLDFEKIRGWYDGEEVKSE